MEYLEMFSERRKKSEIISLGQLTIITGRSRAMRKENMAMIRFFRNMQSYVLNDRSIMDLEAMAFGKSDRESKGAADRTMMFYKKDDFEIRLKRGESSHVDVDLKIPKTTMERIVILPHNANMLKSIMDYKNPCDYYCHDLDSELHPADEVELMIDIARMANRGHRLTISINSLAMLQVLNNMMMLSKIPRDPTSTAIEPEKVAVYDAISGCRKVQESDHLIGLSDFEEVYEKIKNEFDKNIK